MNQEFNNFNQSNNDGANNKSLNNSFSNPYNQQSANIMEHQRANSEPQKLQNNPSQNQAYQQMNNIQLQQNSNPSVQLMPQAKPVIETYQQVSSSNVQNINNNQTPVYPNQGNIINSNNNQMSVQRQESSAKDQTFTPNTNTLEKNDQTNKKKFNKKVRIILVVLVLIGFLTVLVLNFKNIIFNDGSSKISYNLDIDTNDYKIAKILFSEYFGNNFNERMIKEASYDDKTNTFRCKYVSKIYSRIYEDSVSFATSNFITYSLSTVKYEKKDGMYISKSSGTIYNNITTKAKNEILDLAKEKGYYTDENISDDDYNKILQIIFKNDKNNISSIIEKNNYVLKYNSLSDKKIIFSYVDKKNDSNFILIESSLNDDGRRATVYGSSNKEIGGNSEYSETLNEYITDYWIDIEEDYDELKKIYEKLK